MSLVCSGWVVFYDCCLIVFSLTIVAGKGGEVRRLVECLLDSSIALSV